MTAPRNPLSGVRHFAPTLAALALCCAGVGAAQAQHHGHGGKHWVGGGLVGHGGYGYRGPVHHRPTFGTFYYQRPLVYSLLAVGAVTYLHSNGVYYREYPVVGYEVVQPPRVNTAAWVAAPLPADPNPNLNPNANNNRLYVYPRNAQSAEQQATDEYQCHQWAVQQSGFDPSAAATGQRTDGMQRDGYARARVACLEGRGYTTR